MSLKTGDYLLFASDLQHRPIGPKSFTDPPTDVIVQSAGAQAHKVSNDILMPPHAYSDYVFHSGTSKMLTGNIHSRSTIWWR